MRSLLVLLAGALLSFGVSECGGTSEPTGSTSTPSKADTTHRTPASTTSAQNTKPDADKDDDISEPKDDKTNSSVLNYGHAANTVDRQAVTKLVKRYYAVAAAGDGASACSMFSSSLKASAVEDYGHGSAGPSYLSSGKTCSQTAALLFKHFHAQLAAELPLLEVRSVRLQGHAGLAVLRFGTMPEREIYVHHEGHAWKIRELLDNELP